MGKILRKRLKRLEKRRSDYDNHPPKAGKYGRQDHGTNRNGNMAKRPGSMS